ncbi:MAG: substrate-binding periplasmic protein [Streptosporangiaceae bacterium]
MRTASKTIIGTTAIATAVILSACGSSGGSSSSSASNTSAAATTGFHLVTPGYLTVATHGTEPPEISISLSGVLGGADGAWINAFAQQHHLKVKLFQTTFSSAILAVQDGKADLGVAAYYSPTRAKAVYFTYPFYQEDAAVLTLPGFKYTGPASLQGKPVGTVTGFVWQPYLQKAFGSNLHAYPDTATIGRALLNGSIVGYFDTVTANTLAPLTPSNTRTYVVSAGQFGMPESVLVDIARNYVNCSNTGLAAAMNTTMANLHKSGEWAKILTANHLTSIFDPTLTTEPNGC